MNPNIEPVEIGEFSEVFGIWTQAYARKIRVIPPDAELLPLKAKPGEVAIRLKDIPMNQAGMAVVEYYGKKGRVEKSKNAIFRIMALTSVLQSPLLKFAIIDLGPGQVGIDPSVLEYAASQNLENGEFNLDKMVASIKKTIEERDL